MTLSFLSDVLPNFELMNNLAPFFFPEKGLPLGHPKPLTHKKLLRTVNFLLLTIMQASIRDSLVT